MRYIFATALILSTGPTMAQSEPLNLSCGGGGSATKIRDSSANIYGSNGDYATVQGTETSDVGFRDQVDVRLFSGDDRIRLPRIMLPPVRGGDNGWFKLKNVRSDERSITASAAVNVINSPKVHIDRVAGTISINGKAGSYSGQCQRIDLNAKPQF